MSRPAVRHHGDDIAADGKACGILLARQPDIAGCRDAPGSRCRYRINRRLFVCAGLDLHQGYQIALADNEIDFTHLCFEPLRDDAISLDQQGNGGQPLG